MEELWMLENKQNFQFVMRLFRPEEAKCQEGIFIHERSRSSHVIPSELVFIHKFCSAASLFLSKPTKYEIIGTFPDNSSDPQLQLDRKNCLNISFNYLIAHSQPNEIFHSECETVMEIVNRNMI